MKGGVLQERTHRDVVYVDGAVRQLRTFFGCLERETARDGFCVQGCRGQISWSESAQAQAEPQVRSRVMAGINLLAVLVAAIVAFVVGGVWYAPLLFGEGWQTKPRFPEHLRAHKPALIFGLGFLLSLISALMFAIFLGPRPSMQVAVLTGFAAGLAWIAMGLAKNFRPGMSKIKGLELSFINGGFHTVQFTVLGLVFANFQ